MCKCKPHPLLRFARARGLTSTVTDTVGLEYTQTYLRTLVSAHPSTIVLPSPSSHRCPGT
jgi:hypothetical protein